MGVRPFERHGLVLLIAGLVYVAIGISAFNTELTEQRRISLKFALGVMDLPAWGVVFVLAGTLAVVSSRWPPMSETWGYTVLTGLSVGWGLLILSAILFAESPASNMASALTWGLLGFMWWAVSGLNNPKHMQRLANDITALQQENLELHKEMLRRLDPEA